MLKITKVPMQHFYISNSFDFRGFFVTTEIKKKQTFSVIFFYLVKHLSHQEHNGRGQVLF